MFITLFHLSQSTVTALGGLFTFACVFFLLSRFKDKLPTDIGRAYAVNAEKSKGKPRGAGIIIILAFCAAALLFAPLTIENTIYILLITAAMVTGFLDDASRNPWSDYKKGALDLIISLGIAVTFVLNNSTVISFKLFGALFGSNCSFEMPKVIYAILATILVWMAINVINCTDGVDGLCTTLSIISLFTLTVFSTGDYTSMCVLFLFALLAYLWFNASPSIMLMGDAGSRAIGVFMAIAVMKTGAPLLFLPICAMFIIDGGLGLVKVFLLRFFKIRIFPNTRMPLHDHFRKEKGWSDTQTVLRFAIIQAVICLVWLFI